MKLTAILASAVLIEAHVSSLLSKMMINFTPGCLVLQEKLCICIYCTIYCTIDLKKKHPCLNVLGM